jgi:hypothetical protein
LNKATFKEVHSQITDTWGSPLTLPNRLPQTLFENDSLGVESKHKDQGPWQRLQQGLGTFVSDLIAAQIVARLVPCGLDQSDPVFDQETVSAYRSYLTTSPYPHQDVRQSKLLTVLGGCLTVEGFVGALERDLRVFENEQEDERFKVVRPLVIRLIQRRLSLSGNAECEC